MSNRSINIKINPNSEVALYEGENISKFAVYQCDSISRFDSTSKLLQAHQDDKKIRQFQKIKTGSYYKSECQVDQ